MYIPSRNSARDGTHRFRNGYNLSLDGNANSAYGRRIYREEENVKDNHGGKGRREDTGRGVNRTIAGP